LFVVTEGVRSSGIARALLEQVQPALEAGASGQVAGVTGISLVLSNLVSNVPAVMLLGPMLAHLPSSKTAWLALAMGSTFAGNLPLIGSLANLIVAELSKRECPISFVEYLKVGVPLTLLTSAVGVAVLALQA